MELKRYTSQMPRACLGPAAGQTSAPWSVPVACIWKDGVDSGQQQLWGRKDVGLKSPHCQSPASVNPEPRVSAAGAPCL